MIYVRRNGRRSLRTDEPVQFTRRQVLSVLAAAVLLQRPRQSAAALDIPEQLQPLIREAAGQRTPMPGKIKISLPPLAESGNSVPLKIQVESPMTAADFVKTVHVFSERNPRPVIARFHLSPQSGKAEINTRIRLAGTQRVFALAVMNDGTAWITSTEVVVTAAACIDEKSS